MPADPNLTTAEIKVMLAAYEAAKVGRAIDAAKRIHIEERHSDSWDWHASHGKDDSCFAEGSWNHWRWCAMLILGLADPADAPYSEEKPTPELFPRLARHALKLEERVRVMREAMEKLRVTREAAYARYTNREAAVLAEDRYREAEDELLSLAAAARVAGEEGKANG